MREALQQRPFKAFTIRVADGREFVAEHPDFIAVNPFRVYLTRLDGSCSVLAMDAISSFELPSEESTSAN
jgi:hypothetical protein